MKIVQLQPLEIRIRRNVYMIVCLCDYDIVYQILCKSIVTKGFDSSVGHTVQVLVLFLLVQGEFPLISQPH